MPSPPAAIEPTFPLVTLNDVRHTAASLAVSAGAKVKASNGCSATRPRPTLDTYKDVFDDDLVAVSGDARRRLAVVPIT